MTPYFLFGPRPNAKIAELDINFCKPLKNSRAHPHYRYPPSNKLPYDIVLFQTRQRGSLICICIIGNASAVPFPDHNDLIPRTSNSALSPINRSLIFLEYKESPRVVPLSPSLGIVIGGGGGSRSSHAWLPTPLGQDIEEMRKNRTKWVALTTGCAIEGRT